ncbi:hypothetical protein [Providencia vermicola]|uniref:hypothetical protein n=1 Tax=Providencia vermicola TaxID=333965 RepID=UPI001CEE0401|nr:hypothetical protein [Providencia vermicola]
MGILFLFSLLLAWPTYGISIILYIGIFTYLANSKDKNNFVKNKTVRNFAKNDETRYPSWIDNENELSIFLEVVQQLSLKKGVPLLFYTSVFKNKNSKEKIFSYLMNIEKSGASFIEQQILTSEIIYNIWEEQKKVHSIKNIEPSYSPISSIVNTHKNNTKNHQAFIRFLYLTRKTNKKIKHGVNSLKIPQDKLNVFFANEVDYSNLSIPKIKIELKSKNKETLDILFFKINKNLDKKVLFICFLFKELGDDSFFYYLAKNHKITNNTVIGDNLDFKFITNGILNAKRI